MNIQTSNRIAAVEEYYFSRKLAEVRALSEKEKTVINLGIGSPDLAPSDNTVRALVQSAQNKTHHGYQNYRGIPALREAISNFYKRMYHVDINPVGEILPLMGSKEGIFHICMAYINDGDEVLVPNPGYPTYAAAAAIAGAKVSTYQLKEELNWSVDLEALESRDYSKTKIMFINYPHMPTGRIANVDELTALINLALKHQFLLVNDNPYSFILNDHPTSILNLPNAKEVCVELNSLSKSHNMAGWRIGWLAGNSCFIDAFLRVKSNMDSGMFLGLQHAAIEALNADRSWFDQQNEIYLQRQKYAQALLDMLDCHYNREQSGMFMWAKAPDGIKDIEKWLDEILYGAHVFITPGFIFGDQGNRYIRLSLCSNEDTYREAIDRVNKWRQEQVIMKKPLAQ